MGWGCCFCIKGGPGGEAEGFGVGKPLEGVVVGLWVDEVDVHAAEEGGG